MEPNLGAIALTSADTVPWSAPFDPEVGGSWLCSVPFGAHLAASVLVHSQLHPVELQWHLTLRPTVRLVNLLPTPLQVYPSLSLSMPCSSPYQCLVCSTLPTAYCSRERYLDSHTFLARHRYVTPVCCRRRRRRLRRATQGCRAAASSISRWIPSTLRPNRLRRSPPLAGCSTAPPLHRSHRQPPRW